MNHYQINNNPTIICRWFALTRTKIFGKSTNLIIFFMTTLDSFWVCKSMTMTQLDFILVLIINYLTFICIFDKNIQFSIDFPAAFFFLKTNFK